MMKDYLVELALYLACFAFALYGMRALDFKKLLKNNRAGESWILWMMCAMALAYLTAAFLKGISLR